MSIAIEKVKLLLSLVLVLLIPLLFGEYIPSSIKAISYSISLSFKSILIFILPFIIFSFVFSCLLSLKTGVVRLVILLISFVFISNYIAIMTGYFVGNFFTDIFAVSSKIDIDNSTSLQPLWHFEIPQLISNKIALMSGFILGIAFSIQRYKKIDLFAQKINMLANLFLKKVFIPIIPLFILGFVFKLEYDQLLTKALKIYGPFFFVIIGTQISYMVILYTLANSLNFKKALFNLKNVLPATITGLSTVSSAASMPVLIICSEKNVSTQMAKTIIPSTINIHTLGSAIGITVLSLVTCKMFGVEVTFNQFIVFAFYYAVAKFAVAAVPGGVIVVVYPLLETYLNFSPDMLGLMTAMYMLFDPFGTATNVTGNGFFVIAFEKLYNFLIRPKEELVTQE